MIAVFVRHKDNPEFRGTAFARDWTELFWVIDETFRDPHYFLVTYIGAGKQYRDTTCHTVVQCVTQ